MPMKGLVLAGGEGTRLRPLTLSVPKHLIPLLGKTMIEYPINHLISAGIRDIGIVVGYLGHLIHEYLGDGSKYGAKFTYIRQECRLGIAHAIHLAIENKFLDDQFVVYLGDNILSRGIEKYVKMFQEGDFDVYVVLCKVRNPSKFGVAILKNGQITKLVEKPKDFISDMAVTGVYFFRDPDLVEKAFKTLKPSWRGEYEITELIQWFIDQGYDIGYSVVTKWWKDVGTPEGLLEALYFLLDEASPRIDGDVQGEVIGRVIVEKNAVINGKVYGPAYVGKNVFIEKNATIEHYVSIESGSRIRSGYLTRTLVLNDSLVDVNKLRVADSVIGKCSYISCKKELHGTIRLVTSDYSRVEI